MSDRAAEADAVSHASLNGVYIKAQELDRGQNEGGAPQSAPPGAVLPDDTSHASPRAEGATSHAIDAQAHASNVEPPMDEASADAQARASSADAKTHASDADSQTHASDSGTQARDALARLPE